MDWTQIIITAIAVLFSGGVSGYLGHSIARKKIDLDKHASFREDFIALKQAYQENDKALREEIRQLTMEIDGLKEEREMWRTERLMFAKERELFKEERELLGLKIKKMEILMTQKNDNV